jgi:NAD-dependent DNA ligase
VLLSKHGVATVAKNFTKKTSVVIFNTDQTDTSKLKRAIAAGLNIIPYEDLKLELL